MIRRFNYTGRKKIERSRVGISLRRPREGDVVFDADLQLGGLDVPLEARVYVEAYYKASFMRFDFGTVANIVEPASRRLTDTGGGDVVFFRVRVVDLTGEHGRLLAEVDGVTPRQPDSVPANRRCLLYVNFKDLGEEVWRLEFDNPMPVLEVNDRIENIRDIVLTDRKFRSLVYPAAVREILQRILIIEEHDAADDDGEWASLWLRFVRRFHTVDPPRLDPDSNAARQARLEWIDEAVHAFCQFVGARESFALAGQEGPR
jgi:hypothetical protein